jgi:hypothetical protein
MNWKISRLDRKTADGFVTTAHWTVTATDGDFSASAYGTCGFDGELTTPYDDLTQEQVLGWVWKKIDKTEIETKLTAEIQAKKNPKTATGLPWNIE